MTTPAHPSFAHGLSRRLILSLVIVAITIVPALVMVLVMYIATGKAQGAATWASLPAIVGIAAVVNGGRRFAIIVAFVMGFLAPLSIVAGTSPVAGAAMMALLCMTVGRLSRVGLHKSGLMVPVMIAWPLIDPPALSGQATVDRGDTSYLLWMTVIFFVGAILPALFGPLLLRKKSFPAPQPHSQKEVIPYTIMITVLVTAGTFYVLDTPRMYGGAFLIAAILVLAPIGTSQTLKPTLLRVIGTVIGTVFVVAIVSKVDSLAWVYLIGLVFITIALVARFGPRGWIYYVFMTPATACLNATSLTQVGQLGEQRVVDNLIGGILVLLATALAIGFSSWASKHGRASDSDPEVANLTGAEPVAAAAH